MAGLLDTVVQGMLLGGMYALFALGQSLLFGVMRLTDAAHGDFIVLAAFAASSLAFALGLPPVFAPWVALLVLLPIAFAAGYALQRAVLNGTLGKDVLPSLVVTFGLAIVVENVLQQIYTADPRSIDSGALGTASVEIGGAVTIGVLPALILAVAVGFPVGLPLFFCPPPPGRAFRAVGDDLEAGPLMGLHHPPVV